MDTYVFLQHYWWAVVSLLGATLVFLLFVQGGNSLLFQVGRNDMDKQLVINSTGRKWEFTFTTLVTFGGAFFASFPLFYSTSFGGAYWLWMIILFTFVLQAVSYEFQSKLGNLLGRKTYRIFLVINGVVGPFLLGAAVATFFTGSDFIVDKGNLTDLSMPVISGWANASHGLDALLNIWNVFFGLAVFFLARILGALYFINNIDSEKIAASSRRVLKVETVLFLAFFLAFFSNMLLGEGFAVAEDGTVFMERYKYLHNFLEMPLVAAVFLIGVALLLAGIVVDGYLGKNRLSGKGIFFSGSGTVLAVFGLLLCAGYNGTAFYPSTADLQSSLTIANSCSSEFTLKTMAYVSILVPFVIAYIAYAWKAINSKKLSSEELEKEEEKY